MSWSAPSIFDLYDVVDKTWPAASFMEQNGWIIRKGMGGGKRVSAATMITSDALVSDAENFMIRLGQDRMFMIRQGEQELDETLESLGYTVIDPVVFLCSKLVPFTNDDGPKESSITPEMAVVWAAGGIGPDRLAVMNRAKGAKLFSNIDNKAVAFSAIHNGICMTHAVEVLEGARRQGLGRKIMHQVQQWAANQGAETMAVITVKENQGAINLYKSLGMTEVGNYHYRIKR